jgi:hypothetical protein
MQAHLHSEAPLHGPVGVLKRDHVLQVSLLALQQQEEEQQQ